MAIIVNDLSEKDAESQVKTSILDKITGLGGKVVFEDFWGARGFAYKINNKTWGYYFVAQFEMDAQKVSEFRDDLAIDTKIVRSLISTVDPRDPAPKKYAEIQKENAALEKNSEKKEAPTEIKEKPASAPKKEEKSAAPKDAVDQKFDKIIADSSL